MLEKAVENALTKGVKLRSGIAPKCEKIGKGWPDRVVLAWKARIAFVELKRPDGKLGTRQRLIAKMLRALGFDVFCLYSVEEVEAWLEGWFK